MCPSLIEIGSKTAEKNCTNKQTNRHYENNGHLAVNQYRLTVAHLREWPLQSLQEAIIQTSDIGGNFRSLGEVSPRRCLDKTLYAPTPIKPSYQFVLPK